MSLRIHMQSHQEGYTLLELLVVLAVIGLLLSVVPSLLSTLVPSTELKAARSRLASDIRETRSNAIEQGIGQSIDVMDEGTAYRLSPVGTVRRMPSGLRLSLTPSAYDRISTKSGALLFFPDGSSNGGTISIRSSRAEMAVRVDWLTGAVAGQSP